jgi:hypothetical protein
LFNLISPFHPSSAHQIVSLHGRNLGSIDSSVSLHTGKSVAVFSLWYSDSFVRCRTSNGIGSRLSLLASVSVEFSDLSDVFSYAIALVPINISLVPCTGATHAVVFGRSYGSSSYSAKIRLSGSTLEATEWRSDSFVWIRTNSGVPLLKLPMIFSLPVPGLSVIASLSSSFCYSTPLLHFSIATPQRLSNIDLLGSNFGTYNGIIPFRSSCFTRLLPMKENTSVCEISMLEPARAGLKISTAIFNLSFTKVSRLDDLTIYVDVVTDDAILPTTYILMKNKCSCYSESWADFQFQAVPFGLPHVPGSSCATYGSYSPEAAVDISTALDKPGKWILKVGTGGSALSLLSASIVFVTEHLLVRIGASRASSVSWLADSSLKMQVPGYQDSSTSRSSGGGHGRNHPVTAAMNSLLSSHSGNYSYPDPVVTGLSSHRVPTTGGAHRVVTGFAFSNIASSPVVRFTWTTCTGSFWASDTSVSCRLSRFSGRAHLIAASVAFSAIASLLVDAFQETPSISSSSRICSASSGANVIHVHGARFGHIGSITMRSRNQVSASFSTLWASDTAVFVRQSHVMDAFSILISMREFSVSLSSVHRGVAAFVSCVSPNVLATTGSVTLLTAGLYSQSSASPSLSLSRTSCMLTNWISHSSLFCKTSWGSGTSLVITASVARMYSNTTSLNMSYADPQVSDRFSFANASSLNSSECFFSNATICSQPQIVGFESNASGFGAFPIQTKVFLEGTQCNHVTWFSDSAVYCLCPNAVSKALFTLNFTLSMTSIIFGPYSYYLSVGNPLFIPNRNRLQANTSLFATIQWPGDGTLSKDAIDKYERTGRASGESMKSRQSFLAVAEFFEYVSVQVIIYINDTVNSDLQIFMDSNFIPISKTVFGKFYLFNRSSGVDASSTFCHPQHVTSITILPEKYAAVATIEMSFCSQVEGILNLVFISSTSDEHIGVVHLPAEAISLVVRPPGPASVSVNLLSMSEFTVGIPLPDSILISFKAGSGLSCSRTRFEFILALECQSEAKQSSGVNVFKLTKNGAKSTLFQESVKNCLTAFSDLWFIVPSSRCVLNLSVPLAGLFVTSTPFAVLPGLGTTCRLIGTRVNCVSAGALIWSLYNASRRCLSVQLLDEEGNYASSTKSSIAVQARLSNFTAYALLNPSIYIIGSDGNVRWCQLYSTNTSQLRVSFGVAVGQDVVWFAGSFDISSPGPPAMLSALPTSNPLFSQLLAGQSQPAINVTITDAAGNSVAKIANPLVIRIVVRTARKFLSSSSRVLMEAFETTISSVCPSITYVNVSEGSPGHVSISPPPLCTSGQNEIFYTVGEIVGGFFVPSFDFELATSVTVIPGPFESFTLNFPTQFRVRSYSLFKNAAVSFRDKGMNVVSGSARFMFKPLNPTFRVHPFLEFDVASNGTEAFLPFLVISASGWMSTTFDSIVLISVTGSVNCSNSNIISINMTSTCLPGSRLMFPSDSANLTSIYQALLSGHSVTCVPCTRPRYDSWTADAPECLTLQYVSAPTVVHCGKALTIDNIQVMTDSDRTATYASGWNVSIMLQRAGYFGSAVNAIVSLQQGRSQPITTVPIYAEVPDSTYQWVLQLNSNHGNSFPVFNITLSQYVTVLDFSPVSLKIAPSALSHDGHASITVTGFFPTAVSQRAFFSVSTLPARRNSSCFLSSSSSSKTISLTVLRFNATSFSISFVCGPLLVGDSGPPISSLKVTMMLSDGRESESSLIDSYCPIRSYVKLASGSSSQLQCLRCPPDRSSSLRENSMGEESCVCSAKYYGTFGDGCIACPKNVDGFNCSLSNQSRPIIQSGFYIDYSQLSSCSEHSPKCPAIVKCPNPSACPGTTEKDCLKTVQECYDSESFGCTACCPRYYIENFVCKPCPSSQLPLILSFCILGLILFAVFSSSFDFPPLVSVAHVKLQFTVVEPDEL